MKNIWKHFFSITLAALTVISIAACSSGPRVNRDGYFEPDIIRTDSFHGHVGYVDPSIQSHGIAAAPDGTDAYYIENAKTKIQENLSLGSYDIITWLNPTNTRGYIRYEFDLAFDNRELVEEIEALYFQLQNQTSWQRWDSTDDWNRVKQGFLDNPTVFQTVSVNFPDLPDFTDGPDNPRRDTTLIFHRLSTTSDEVLPGKIYIRGNRFYP